MAEEKLDLFAQVNAPANLEALTDLEKKHVPVITAPDAVKSGECFEVIVEVGKLLAHPNELAHFIEFIELYAGHVYLARMDFTAKQTCPIMRVCVALPKDLGPLRAFERCNLHGVWTASKPIAVR
ncbi:MAG TPA: class II SORL domain-containing protein [Planctomycetota bacterium]|nr:class II SORL domain-containing protein [Planctomycetota bacterium]HRR81128.1 class II SORL domain-containing protein [Planctomycetota bacterium]HRT96105.1 class II SORL domain-containing protein [Planctomycetota bacterium]